MTPNKKSMAAAFAFFGSSISGIVRYFFGRWVPSWQQLIYNKVLTGSAISLYIAAFITLPYSQALSLTFWADASDVMKSF